MRSSYREDDVILLLKDITGMIQPQPTEEREKLIQSGKHYSEMLTIEYVPIEKYMKVYEDSLQTFSKTVANAVGVLCDRIIEQIRKRSCSCFFGACWYSCWNSS